ncbi:tetratricopeptide repeat protein [Roseibium sp. AS2]|uniref:tetratricopeptide repeat protein n=1 Tax=Roseibium sp. AS2 TaxID=3135781 RepID=UPI003172B0A6
MALLASAPNGRRTRAWLQDMLWPRSGEQHGRASLRQSLAKLKRILGSVFSEVVESNNQDVWMNLDALEFLGSPLDGALLEGLDLAGADGFESWLTEQRQRLVAGLEDDDNTGLRAAVPARPSGGQSGKTEFRPLKLRPAIAILPFAHCTADTVEATFGDMIAGDLSRQIARAHGIDVISHLSCRMPGFVDADLKRLRETYCVDYLVTGFLRSSGNTLTLDLEFTDSGSGVIVNAQRFERTRLDWLHGGADVLQDIASYVVDSLFKGAIRSVATRSFEDLDAHMFLMSAISLMHRQDLASVLRSHQYLESIIDRFGPCSLPYAWLAQWYVLFLAQGWSTDIAEDKNAARLMVQRALEANPDCSFSRIMDGVVSYQLERDYARARLTFDDVLAVDENNALAWFWKGTAFAFEGAGREAVAFTDRGRLLTPLDPGGYLYSNLSGTAHLSNRSFQKALELADYSLKLNRHHASALRTKIVALHGLRRLDEARKAAAELLKLYPGSTIENYLSAHPAGELELGREWAHALENSGIPKR